MLPFKVRLILLIICVSNCVVHSEYIWHEGAINCYNCETVDDCADSWGSLRKCVNNDTQTCLTIFNANGAVIKRGCSDALRLQCNANGTICYECKSHGCNNVPANAEFVDCLNCDAQNDQNCIFNTESITDTRQCYGGCMTALYPRTSDANAPKELVRSCLDDLNYDERDDCAANNNSDCLACTTSKCNTVNLGNRGICYQCNDGNCNEPQSRTCRAVLNSERCSILFNEYNEIVEFGCSSDYNANTLINLIQNRSIWLCDGENCNTVSALPQTQSCILCNSRTDPNCAFAPELVESSIICETVPYTNCYMRILESGHTERGCISSLEDDFYNCFIGANNSQCFSCAGSNCNAKIYPTDRLMCHVCNSELDDSCENAPETSTIQVCLLYNPNEKCVASINNAGNTIRGCSSSVICDPSDPRNCKHCVGHNCNTVNLKRRHDGKPGQWQELPLKCLTCNSIDSCTSTSSSSQLCSGQDYCMTVFAKNGSVTARGCSSLIEDVYESYCDSNVNNCFNCNSNECNSAESVSNYVDCLYCDSLNYPNCANNPSAIETKRKCNGQCMTALYQRQNSNTYDLSRSCLDDKDKVDQSRCTANEDNECIACSGAACNTDQLPETRLSCFLCEGDNCEDPDPAFCANYAPDDQCYILFDEYANILSMGCLTDLDNDFVDENIHRLQICNSGDNCNSFENLPTPNNCVVCNSNENEDCAINPQNVNSINLCNIMPNTKCMTRLLSDGSVQRGCVSNLSNDDLKTCLLGNGNCVPCTGVLCNQEIYPADRRRCQRCTTEDDPTCESTHDASSVCPRYKENQGCSVKLVDGHTYRGCETEFICDDADKQYCRMCYNDNCNVVNLFSNNIGYPGKWQTPPINCYICYGNDCHGENLGLLQKCDSINQNCATIFASNGSVVQRSCSDAVYSGELGQYCDENPNSCKFCKSTACNNALQLTNYTDCILCDGAENDNCVSNVTNISRRVSCQNSCVTGLYPRNSSDTTSALELYRGCFDDLEYDDRIECANGNKALCKSCNGHSCNTDTIPESRLNCNYCSDAACTIEISKQCTAYREHDQCYIHVGDLRIESMGCASDLETTFIQLNRRDILLCDGDNCNVRNNLNEVGISCAVCNSSASEICIANPNNLATVCQHYLYPQCISRIDENGILFRGCLMDTNDSVFDDCLSGNSATCQVCDSNNCNTQLYPENRLSCLRCDSANNFNCEKNPKGFSSYCPIYKEDDVCVAKLEKTRTLRGCSTEFSCYPNSTDCHTCSTNDCNQIDFLANYVGEPGKWQTLPLNCYVCNNEDECASGASVHKCTGNILQVCVTVFDESNQVIKRGCSDNVDLTHSEYCEENSGQCFRCKSNGCNNAINSTDFIDCYFCDSDENPSCSQDTPTTSTTRTRKCHKQCVTAMYPRSSAIDTAYLTTRTCLDDLELDDQEECLTETRKYCNACEGSLCNTYAFIESPHICYYCLDGECEDIISQKCSAYRPNDQCYIAFTNATIISMGCASDFETNVLNELVQQQQLLLCDGENCNHPSSIPDPVECTLCDSTSNSQCATNPNTIFSTTICSQLPYTQCVARVNEDGYTQRGCLSELESSIFYSCLTGTDPLCQACEDYKCNGLNVIPENRLRCHQCDSSFDPNCANNPNSISFCPLHFDNDACITTLRGNITIRGCNSTVNCDNESDSRSCRICSGDGCNTIDLNKINSDGSPGVWQNVPLNCYKCNNETDCAESWSISKCQGNPYQNCITVFNNNNKVIQRGCFDNVYENQMELCNASPANCPRCNSNGCNVATNLEEYVHCVTCDSQNNDKCVTSVSEVNTTRQCYKYCMTAFLGLFNEENDAYSTVRSCYDDMDMDDRNQCEAGDKQYCAVCSDSQCNVDDIVEERFSCYICTGDGCQVPPSHQCSNYRENDQCFIEFDDSHFITSLGCASQYSHADKYILRKSKRLLTCDDANCNNFESILPPEICAVCNSRTDLNCAINPSAITSETKCSLLGIPQCYSRVLSDGVTERGCLSNLNDDEFLSCYNGTSNGCKMCLGETCNKGVYPANRTSCHICSSDTNANCESSPNALSLCPLYAENDVCVTQYLKGITYRGCGISLTCDESLPNCVKCSGNGCNDIDLASKLDDNYGKWQDLPLTCLTCFGNDCNSNVTTTEELCQNNNEQDCITVFDEEGNVIRRGCSDAIVEEYCSQSGFNCFNCKSNRCNTATSKSQFTECIYCDSFKDVNCLWNATSTSHRKRQCQGGCMSALYSSYDGENPAFDLIRTCLNDKETFDQESCTANNDANCAACSSSNCNVANIPTERLTCFICESDDCEEPEPKLCPLYKSDDKCFTWVDENNSISSLGCLSSFRNQDLESVIKTKRVIVCDGANCNIPAFPSATRCAICDSKTDPNCAVNAQNIGTFELCSNMPYTHCVTRLENDGSTTRGCLFDIPQDDFAACVLGTNANCTICAQDGCNREVFPPDRLQCYTCSSSVDPHCESYPDYLLSCPIVSNSERCITSLSNNVTTRGCSSDIVCNIDDYLNCRTCQDSECNGIDLRNRINDGLHGQWQELPLRCHNCVGEHCHNSLGPAYNCTRNFEQDCKTVFEEDGLTVRRRGCVEDVDDYEDMYCRQHPQLCFTCKSNECNTAWSLNDYVDCIYCDSRQDHTCITHPTNSNQTNRSCHGQCMVSMIGSHLIRTCLDDKEPLDRNDCSNNGSGNVCARCDGELCNDFVYPDDRLSCHICNDANCTTSVVEYCLHYENNFCFAKYENGQVDLMGCGLTQNQTDLDQWAADNKLYRCNSNECNELTRLPKSSVCVSCISNLTPNCAQDPIFVTSTENCHPPIAECVTYLNEGNHTIRGCLNSLNSNEQSSCVALGTCAACPGPKCNIEIFPANRRRCHICNSASDYNCLKEPNSLRVCPVYSPNDSCVARNIDGIVERGCYSQFTCDTNDERYCKICSEDGCNTADVSGAAGLLGSDLILTLVLALSLII